MKPICWISPKLNCNNDTCGFQHFIWDRISLASLLSCAKLCSFQLDPYLRTKHCKWQTCTVVACQFSAETQGQVQSHTPGDVSCALCAIKHVFCFLYLRGPVPLIHRDQLDVKQVFICPEEITSVIKSRCSCGELFSPTHGPGSRLHKSPELEKRTRNGCKQNEYQTWWNSWQTLWDQICMLPWEYLQF